MADREPFACRTPLNVRRPEDRQIRGAVVVVLVWLPCWYGYQRFEAIGNAKPGTQRIIGIEAGGSFYRVRNRIIHSVAPICDSGIRVLLWYYVGERPSGGKGCFVMKFGRLPDLDSLRVRASQPTNKAF
jgi:hypothetical protein